MSYEYLCLPYMHGKLFRRTMYLAPCRIVDAPVIPEMLYSLFLYLGKSKSQSMVTFFILISELTSLTTTASESFSNLTEEFERNS